MGKVTGAIGRALTAGADAAAPFVMEDVRAKIMAKRDSVLQGYNMEQQKSQQDFASSENAANREHQSAEGAINREFEAGQQDQAQEFTGEQNDLNRAIEQARLDLQGDAQALDSQRLNSIIELTNLQIKDLGLDTAKKEQVNQLQQAVLDANTPEILDAALTKLQGFLGKELYSPMTVYGEYDDATGQQEKASGVINQMTGGFTPMRPPGPEAAAGGQTDDPLGIRDMFKR